MSNVPDMTKVGRKARKQAWQDGRALAEEMWKNNQEQAQRHYSPAELREFLYGLGQFYNSLAYDMVQQAKQQSTTRDS